MSKIKSHLASTVFVILGAVVVLAVTYIALTYKRCRKLNALLPATEYPQLDNSQQTILQRHIAGLRNWTKPRAARNEYPKHLLKVDPHDLSFNLPRPASSHQPMRPTKGSWSLHQERKAHLHTQEERHRACGGAPDISLKWPFQQMERPKPASYWARRGRDMEAKKTWWNKLRDNLSM
jgi:hypothetical protein